MQRRGFEGDDLMAELLEMSAPALYRSPRPVLSFADARRLASRYGTPLMVISRAAVTRNYRALCDNLPGVEFFYAAKANPHRTILSTLHKLGSSVDVCSYGEARQALRAGFAPEAMLHTHPCKTVRNLVDCYGMGIRWFIYDNAHELTKMAEHAPDAQLLLRLAMAPPDTRHCRCSSGRHSWASTCAVCRSTSARSACRPTISAARSSKRGGSGT